MNYELNKIYNQDCLEAMKQMPDNYYELAIVDPPYFIVSQQKRGVGSRIDKSGNMNKWNHKIPTDKYFKELFRVSDNQIIWGANNYEGLPRTEYFCIWDKKQSVPNFASLEYAWVSMGIGKPAKSFVYSIHQHNADIDRIHPTQKPVPLYKWLLKNYANEGDKILDTHLGSASSVIACIDMGFDFTGFELDKEYFCNAQKRINSHLNQCDLTRDVRFNSLSV